MAVWKGEGSIPGVSVPLSTPVERLGKPPEVVDGPKDSTRPHAETPDPEALRAELDPTARALFQVRPPEVAGAPPPPATAANLEQAAESLLRKVGWGRSGTRAHVQLRVGEGRFANAAITLESDAQHRVTVRVVGGADVDLDALGTVLRSRFERGGFQIDLELEAR